MKIIFSAKTDTGRVRKENQDSYGISTANNTYFICDGMGGGAAGDFASRYAVDIMLRSLDALKTEEINQVAGTAALRLLKSELLPMLAAIRLANRALSNLSTDYAKLSGMGTTVTGVYFDTETSVIHIFHVGDSRVYRLRDGTLELLTKDHSKVNELLDQGKMREDEIKTAEIQSMITRALGTAPKVKIDYKPQYVRNGDYFLLCTDGLNGEIEDSEIRDAMEDNKSNLDSMAERLINAANQAGGRDNTTVILLRAFDDANASPAPDNIGLRKAVMFDEETAEETRFEDRVLKKVMSRSKIQIPKLASQKSFLGNPVVLGAFFALLVALFGLFLPRWTRENTYDTRLIDLAGKVTGLRVDVREPTAEQLQVFRKSEDTVAKLQIIQDWYRQSGRYTLPLKDVELSVYDAAKEQFKGMTGETPAEIKLERGVFNIKLSRSGYSLVTEKLETKDSVGVSVEPSSSYSTVILVMIPAQ